MANHAKKVEQLVVILPRLIEELAQLGSETSDLLVQKLEARLNRLLDTNEVSNDLLKLMDQAKGLIDFTKQANESVTQTLVQMGEKARKYQATAEKYAANKAAKEAAIQSGIIIPKLEEPKAVLAKTSLTAEEKLPPGVMRLGVQAPSNNKVQIRTKSSLKRKEDLMAANAKVVSNGLKVLKNTIKVEDDVPNDKQVIVTLDFQSNPYGWNVNVGLQLVDKKDQLCEMAGLGRMPVIRVCINGGKKDNTHPSFKSGNLQDPLVMDLPDFLKALKLKVNGEVYYFCGSSDTKQKRSATMLINGHEETVPVTDYWVARKSTVELYQTVYPNVLDQMIRCNTFAAELMPNSYFVFDEKEVRKVKSLSEINGLEKFTGPIADGVMFVAEKDLNGAQFRCLTGKGVCLYVKEVAEVMNQWGIKVIVTDDVIKAEHEDKNPCINGKFCLGISSPMPKFGKANIGMQFTLLTELVDRTYQTDLLTQLEEKSVKSVLEGTQAKTLAEVVKLAVFGTEEDGKSELRNLALRGLLRMQDEQDKDGNLILASYDASLATLLKAGIDPLFPLLAGSHYGQNSIRNMISTSIKSLAIKMLSGRALWHPELAKNEICIIRNGKHMFQDGQQICINGKPDLGPFDYQFFTVKHIPFLKLDGMYVGTNWTEMKRDYDGDPIYVTDDQLICDAVEKMHKIFKPVCAKLFGQESMPGAKQQNPIAWKGKRREETRDPAEVLADIAINGLSYEGLALGQVVRALEVAFMDDLVEEACKLAVLAQACVMSFKHTIEKGDHLKETQALVWELLKGSPKWLKFRNEVLLKANQAAVLEALNDQNKAQPYVGTIIKEVIDILEEGFKPIPVDSKHWIPLSKSFQKLVGKLDKEDQATLINQVLPKMYDTLKEYNRAFAFCIGQEGVITPGAAETIRMQLRIVLTSMNKKFSTLLVGIAMWTAGFQYRNREGKPSSCGWFKENIDAVAQALYCALNQKELEVIRDTEIVRSANQVYAIQLVPINEATAHLLATELGVKVRQSKIDDLQLTKRLLFKQELGQGLSLLSMDGEYALTNFSAEVTTIMDIEKFETEDGKLIAYAKLA